MKVVYVTLLILTIVAAETNPTLLSDEHHDTDLEQEPTPNSYEQVETKTTQLKHTEYGTLPMTNSEGNFKSKPEKSENDPVEKVPQSESEHKNGFSEPETQNSLAEETTPEISLLTRRSENETDNEKLEKMREEEEQLEGEEEKVRQRMKILNEAEAQANIEREQQEMTSMKEENIKKEHEKEKEKIEAGGKIEEKKLGKITEKGKASEEIDETKAKEKEDVYNFVCKYLGFTDLPFCQSYTSIN
ncbi:hypothetical protein DdX_12429 [Ditylenchus destructor]|uniref:Uncharacterized protein n=1 Tax=Ditylenchus destructor TaxID=166010 RepID=A0AAD4MY26_9BILA|nr:hypothetical protein DdX_12429 [Ditylenchus destructor]